MTGFQIFHTVVFIILGISLLCNVKNATRPRKQIDLAIGILALLIALYDILVSGFGIDLP